MSSGHSTATRGEVFSPWPTAGQTPTSLSSSSLTGNIYRLLIRIGGLASGFLCGTPDCGNLCIHSTQILQASGRQAHHLWKACRWEFLICFLLELIAPCFLYVFFGMLFLCSWFRISTIYDFLLLSCFRYIIHCLLLTVLLTSCILLFVDFFLVLNVRRCLCEYIPIANT
jgi:hypothetical protein